MRRAPAAAAALAATLTACGGGGGGTIVRVAAASSLQTALTACAPTVKGSRVQLEFGGSDELAARIRAGIKPDVFAAADTKLPAALQADGVGGAPQAFATNTLVLAVPADGSQIHRFADLILFPATTLAVGSPSVPVGSYARQVLARLPADGRAVIQKEIRTEEPDAKGIVGKLLTGAVDAGFVYHTDVVATHGKLREVPIPRLLAPKVVYALTQIHARGKGFVDSLLRGTCSRALIAAGFGAPPGG